MVNLPDHLRATFREPSASAVRKAADGGKTAG